MIVKASALNVRSGPGTEFRILDKVKKGDHVTVVEVSGDWKWIDPGKGWVAARYLEDDPSRPTVPNGLKAIIRVFGLPGNPETHSGRVKLPAPMKLSWADQKVQSFACHKKLEGLFERVFQRIYNAGLWGEVSEFGGCYNDRSTRGGKKKSTHAWGIAVDLNPSKNAMGTPGNMDEKVIAMFEEEGFHWGGRFSGRSRDPMHFQFATGY